MLGGKFKFVLGTIFLLVLLVLVAEAGFYFGVTRQEKIIPTSLPLEAPGPAPIIDQDRLVGSGFEFVKRGVVKGITIEVQLEGIIKEIRGPEWFRIEKNGEIVGYKVGPEEPLMSYRILNKDSGEEILGSWQDLRVGDKVILTISHDNETGKIVSHSLTIVR